jgi:outer membrane lipoprotein LolB
MPSFTLKKHVYRNTYPFALLSLLLLSGCASLSTSYSNVDTYLPDNEQRLQALTQWSIRGKVGIQSPQTNGSATLDWQQHEQNYQIHLFGPMGMGSIYLVGKPQEVNLRDSKGRALSATTPEALLNQIGWQLPVSNLLYWVRGLPIPAQPTTKTLSQKGVLKQLNQQGWQINYLSYQVVDGIWLPDKISLQKSPIKVKIVIQGWKVN